MTGGLGVVGRGVARELLDKGNDVWITDLPHGRGLMYRRCDVSEYRQVENVIEEVKPNLVFHLAAEFGRMNGEDFYETMWRTNVIGTKNLIKLQARQRFRMVFTSSSEIYGDYRGVMTEDVPARVVVRQLNDYAISKWVNELQITNAKDQFGVETVILRLFNSYGPGEYYSPYRSVVCIFVHCALRGLPYVVYTKNKRTLTYIDDMVRAIANVSLHFKPGEVYNIAGDNLIAMKEVSDLVRQETGASDKLVKYEESERHNALTKAADNSKAKADLGLKNTVDLREGIRRTVEWQKANS